MPECEKCGQPTTRSYNLDDATAYECEPCHHWTVISWDDVKGSE